MEIAIKTWSSMKRILHFKVSMHQRIIIIFLYIEEKIDTQILKVKKHKVVNTFNVTKSCEQRV